MPRTVALLIETSNEYARGLLRGVLRYQQEHQRWSIELPEQHRGADPPKWLRRFAGDGIIARIETASIARSVKAANCPTVDVSAARLIPDLPWVETDDQAIAEMAVQHFCERGLRHLAFCGESSFQWSRWRSEAFTLAAKREGLSVDVFDIESETSGATWPQQRRRLIRWLSQLHRPCGLMVAYDSLARRVIDLCSKAGRSVPEDIAVLGVDDDKLLCQLATPPLSSVIPDAEGAGYQAAKLLDAMMDGVQIVTSATLLTPLGIAPRQSTDTVSVKDQDVAAAARFIIQNACQGIKVTDVVQRSPLSRRSLEYRFKELLGKTPHQLIIETRLSHVERLLRETKLSLHQVAQQCGLEYPEYLNRLFRQHRGETPGQYRDRHGT